MTSRYHQAMALLDHWESGYRSDVVRELNALAKKEYKEGLALLATLMSEMSRSQRLALTDKLEEQI